MWRGNGNGDLEGWRRELDGIDSEILHLLSRRFVIVRLVKEWKRLHGKPVVDAIRERDLLSARIAEGVEQGLDPIFVVEIFQIIIKRSRQEQASNPLEVPAG